MADQDEDRMANHATAALGVDITGALAVALEYQHRDEEPPSELDVLLAEAGLGETLEPLTPLPGSEAPTPVRDHPTASTSDALRDVSAKLQSLAAPPPHTRPSRSQQDKRREKSKQAKKRRRAAQRDRERQARRALFGTDSAFENYKVRQSLLRKFKITKTLVLDIDASNLPSCEGQWKGLYIPEGERCITLKEALAMGLKLVEWDGETPVLLLDRSQRIIGVLVGHPADGPGREGWAQTTNEAHRALDALEEQMEWGTSEALPPPPGSDGVNRRGNYCTISEGPSYGGGQTHPMNFKHTPHNRAVLDEFNANPAIQRFTSFASASHAFYAPKLFRYAVRTLQDLYNHDPDLNPGNGPFADRSLNTGSKVATHLHNDHCNLAFGWCAIQALGNFDPREGGHIILLQLGIVVEFPPGATILIPSSIVTHGNTPVPADQTRTSMVHYSAGGLFRWVEYGFRKWENFKDADPVRARRVWAERKTERLRFALSLFSKADELVEDHLEVFGE